jgi:hypothetical protein
MQTRAAHPDRRNISRESSLYEPPRAQLVAMILGTYREMPGLRLHLNQAVRLFGLPPSTCQVVLEDLVGQGKLRRTHDGQYAV